MFRFKVVEASMTPHLSPGEEFVATDSRRAVRGEVVATLHPGRDDFWLVKRLAAIGGDDAVSGGQIANGMAWVVSDNNADGVVDSRSFGPVQYAKLRPVVTRLDAATFLEAVDLLIAEDPHLKSVVDEFDVPPFWARSPGFGTLVLLILEQQVSLESAAAVFTRLVGLAGEVTAQRLSTFNVGDLNAVGLTRQKASYVIGIADDILHSRIKLEDLGSMSPPDALSALQGIRGVGPWTAQAYLLSAERLPDLFPIGDRALQVGTGEALGMSAVPLGKELELLAEPWRPIRSVAARILWHGYLSRRGRTEPAQPFSAHNRGPTA